jgi:hypothetical protein
MTIQLFDEVSIGPASRYAREKHDAALTANTEELAGLRFSIILTVLWEASTSADAERCSELHIELAGLRRNYSEKIDEIAMTFGVQSAMNAKKQVERTVAVPQGMKPLINPCEDDQLCI